MDELLNVCGPRIINLPNTADGSLTRADVIGITPDTLVSFEQKATGELQMIWGQMQRARITGVREHTLWDLVMSRTMNTGKLLTEQKVGNRSFFLPYILEEQEDFINVSAFVISNGVASPYRGMTINGVTYPAHAWEIVVGNSPSPWASAIQYPERYFLAGSYVTVLNLSGTSAAQEPSFKVLATEGIDADTCKVTIVPNYTAAGFAGLAGAVQDVYEPTDGIIQIGVNSISDYESYCLNHPAELSKRVIDFWLQNTRYTESYDDITKEYLGYIKQGKVNEYLDKFRTLDMAEYNRRQFANYQKATLNSFFYGQQINENQTVEGYQSLPRVEGRMGEFLEYKSNALGVKELLRRCNRVYDLAGQPLNLNDLEEILRVIRRRREVDGGTVRQIDVMCSRTTAIKIHLVMMGYYKAINRTEFQQKFEPDVIANGQLWEYRSYDLLHAQVKMNVIIEPFFEDWAEHFTGGLATRGNQLVILDWNDIKRGIAKTNQRTARTPDINTDPTLACTIKANVMHHMLESVLWTVMIEDPSRHAWIENFDLTTCPTYTYDMCDPTANE